MHRKLLILLDRRAPSKMALLMPRPILSLAFVALLACGAAGCGDDDPAPTGPTDPLTQTTFTVSGTLNPNGGRTHDFQVLRAGEVRARISGLEPGDAVVGLSLGTFNATGVCQIILANDAATLNTTVVGTASVIGQFCVRTYDVGRLTQNASYAIEISHF